MSIELHNMDCMKAMVEMEDNQFDLAIVDPPYGIGIAEWDVRPDIKYFKELRRVSKNQIIWGGNYFRLPITEGWLCWNKIHGFTTPLKTMSDFELAWTSFLSKSKIIPLNCSGNIIGGQVDYNYKPIHPTQKPIILYKWLLKHYSKKGDKILDTHLGSGSIAIACWDYELDLVGYEDDKEHFEAAKKRIKNHMSIPRGIFNEREIN